MHGARVVGSVVWLLICALFSINLAAQAPTTLSGSVKDSGGGVIPRAFVLVWNQETGLTRTGHTGDAGVYAFPNLQPGLYGITVSAPGFRKLTRSGIRLGVAERVSLDVALQVGRVEEAITITDDEDALTSVAGNLRASVEQRRVDAVPLNRRDVTELILTLAGVVARERSPTEGTGYAVNGNRTSGVSYSLNGGTNTDSYRHHSGVFPNTSAVAEVVIERSGLSAEYGNTTGAVVSVITKSGTNALHASAFEFLRNGALNARDFFSGTRDNLKRSQFGVTAGGPLIRNRLFLFGSYQGSRSRAETMMTRQFLPTAAMRLGDFSSISTPVLDPQTKNPFPQNRIPAARLSSAVQSILRYIPTAAATTGERMISVRDRTGEDEYTARVDYDKTTHRITGHIFRRTLGTPFSGNPSDLASMFTSTVGRSEQPYVHTTLTHVWLPSPSMIHTATAALRTRRTWNDWSGVELPVDFARAGVQGIAVKNPASLYVNVSGYFMARPGWNYDKQDRDLQFSDNLTWMTARHVLKIGGEVLHIHNNIRNDYRTMGNFEFTGAASGNAMADFLLGEVYQFWQGGGEYKELNGRRTALFVQDDWRPTSRLTLNAGVRWEPVRPFRDSAARTQCFAPGAQSTRFPNAPRGYLNGGDAQCPDGGFEPYMKALAPRFGFAWRPANNSMVLRGGAGIYWAPQFTMLYNGFVNSAPFSPQVTLNAVQFDRPFARAANPFPNSFAPFMPSADAAFATPMGQFGAFSQGFRPGYSENINVTAERSLGRYWKGHASWIANLGRRLSYTSDLNYARYDAGATLANLQQRRPYSDFGGIVVAESGTTSSYHGFEMSASRRAPAGVSLEVNYTWSKAIDEYSEESRPGQSVSIAIPDNRMLGRAVSDFDIAHQLVASWVWPTPRFAGDARVLRWMANDWVVSGVTSARTGFPFSIRSGTDRALSGIAQDFADLHGNPRMEGGRSKSDVIREYFDTTAFRPAVTGTFGNSPRNLLRGPGGFALDLAIAREFPLHDRGRMQLRVEMFNTLNHAVLGTPYSSLNSPSRFGRIESASAARTIQMAVQWGF